MRRRGVGYVGIFEGIWPNIVLFLLPHSVAVSLPCLLYSMHGVSASKEPNSTEQRPQE
jgi:hypothetical protein